MRTPKTIDDLTANHVSFMQSASVNLVSEHSFKILMVQKLEPCDTHSRDLN